MAAPQTGPADAYQSSLLSLARFQTISYVCICIVSEVIVFRVLGNSARDYIHTIRHPKSHAFGVQIPREMTRAGAPCSWKGKGMTRRRWSHTLSSKGENRRGGGIKMAHNEKTTRSGDSAPGKLSPCHPKNEMTYIYKYTEQPPQKTETEQREIPKTVNRM